LLFRDAAELAGFGVWLGALTVAPRPGSVGRVSLRSPFPVRIEPEEEVLATVEAACEVYGVRDSLASCLIGTVIDAEISNVPPDDEAPEPAGDQVLRLRMPCELSGVVEVVDGRAHAHVTVSWWDTRGRASQRSWSSCPRRRQPPPRPGDRPPPATARTAPGPAAIGLPP
jgi:predicted DNA-binding protein with PD1-like motif